MRNKYLIIADDLTGANDTGVQLKKNNIDVDVLLFPTGETVDNSVVIDSESRILDTIEAYKKVKSLSENILKNNEFESVYKKIDSTLRGNVAEEIRAVMDAYNPDIVVIAPAYPKIKRTTKGGIHHLNGVPLMKTEIASDPLTPIWTDNITELLSKEFGNDVFNYNTETLEKMTSLPDTKFQLFDIETDPHLELIKELALKDSRKILYVGSAGLAEFLFSTKALPSLSIVGSISDVSLNQMKYAKDKGFHIVNIEIKDLVSDNRIDKYTDLVVSSLQKGTDTILTITTEKKDYTNTIQFFEKIGITDKYKISQIIRETLAEITSKVLQKQEVTRLFLTGGDTAIEVLHSLNAQGCKIKKELSTGIVESTLVGGFFEGLTVVTKAGAFGVNESLYLSMKQ
ncbi:MAG: four-carbon acid sugar kinase family protein [Ruminococcus sp.]|nr:four-carbon acid sugar kinase family protein [Ruminococcus sp.]